MGRVAAARLLVEAQEILRSEGCYGAVDVVGALRLLAEVRCAAVGEPVLEAVPA